MTDLEFINFYADRAIEWDADGSKGLYVVRNRKGRAVVSARSKAGILLSLMELGEDETHPQYASL